MAANGSRSTRSGRSRGWSANGQRASDAGVLIATYTTLHQPIAVRSPMSGVSVAATKAGGYGRETLIRSPRAVQRRRLPRSSASSGRQRVKVRVVRIRLASPE